MAPAAQNTSPNHSRAALHAPLQPAEKDFRQKCSASLSLVEIAIYSLLGILLSATALLGLVGAGHLLWLGMRDWSGTSFIFLLIDRLLFILMLVEILHTVGISIRSHMLVIEPFLIVGLIATIRRMLVLTLQAASLTTGANWSEKGKPLFQASMIELSILGFLIIVLVAGIYALRRTRPEEQAAALAEFTE